MENRSVPRYLGKNIRRAIDADYLDRHIAIKHGLLAGAMVNPNALRQPYQAADCYHHQVSSSPIDVSRGALLANFWLPISCESNMSDDVSSTHI